MCPSRIVQISTAAKLKCFPVGAMPMNPPVFVPEKVTVCTTRSPSMMSSGFSIVRSGKLVMNAR